MGTKIRHESMRIAGKKIDTEKNIDVEYPYTGEIIGKKAREDIKKGTPLDWNLILDVD